MKVVIQIPCYNEEKTLPRVLQSLPDTLPGVDDIAVLIVDDGSTDATSDVARAAGVTQIVRFPKNQGLARAFEAGIGAAVELGADIVVNTDADNQYNAEDIAQLIAPILAGTADIVIGERPISGVPEFSGVKKFLQKVGSWVVRGFSSTNIPDAPSGFRAFSREAALRVNVFNNYTYTLETIIQAGQKNMAITSVPIRINPITRPSRLVRSVADYIVRSVMTIVRIFVVYKPFKFFFSLGLLLFLCGCALGVRFLVYFFSGEGNGHVQSLILASIFLVVGFQTVLVAFLADLLAVNRKLLEDIQYRLRKQNGGNARV